MSKIPQIIFWSLLYSKYIAGDSPCRLSRVCEPFVSELCSLNLAPLPSSFEQHTGNHLPLSSCYVRFSSRTIFTGHLHTHIHDRQGQLQGGQGGRSQLGELLPVTSFLPISRLHFAVAYSTWWTFFLWVTLQGWTAQLSASRSCPVSCHLCLLA